MSNFGKDRTAQTNTYRVKEPSFFQPFQGFGYFPTGRELDSFCSPPSRRLNYHVRSHSTN